MANRSPFSITCMYVRTCDAEMKVGVPFFFLTQIVISISEVEWRKGNKCFFRRRNLGEVIAIIPLSRVK